MRKIRIVTEECYHIFSRGVDKRDIFIEGQDKERFFQTMFIFNSTVSVGSFHEYLRRKNKGEILPLVHFVTYSLLHNHFHFILQQAVEDGISKFMKKLLGGYSWYFNNKYKRTGALFEAPFKAIHIDSNQYLLYVSAYVNLNDKQKIVSVGDQVADKKEYSSWNEYTDEDIRKNSFCTRKHLVLDQFSSPAEYEKFALSVLDEVRANKERYKLLGI